ncbi:hypothetical protein FRC03_011844 [Tulasnella sp. 419]|nr:hypothetical protein FRC03_011844 [Tulasnella sp. 419]
MRRHTVLPSQSPPLASSSQLDQPPDEVAAEGFPVTRVATNSNTDTAASRILTDLADLSVSPGISSNIHTGQYLVGEGVLSASPPAASPSRYLSQQDRSPESRWEQSDVEGGAISRPNPSRRRSQTNVTRDGSRPRREQWTVFGQLLQDDHTPGGARGNETPVHTISTKRRASNLRGTSPAKSPATVHSSTFSSTTQDLAEQPPGSMGDISSKPRVSPSVSRRLSRTSSDLSRSPARRRSVEGQEHVSLESDDESESGSESSSLTQGGKLDFRSQRRGLSLPSLSPFHKNILKCSIGYFIGSLFTFVPFLSSILSDIVPGGGLGGPSPSAHMVATVVVYFNPAKTIGAMLEADSYCLVAAVYSAVVSLTAMSLFWFFEQRPGLEWLADTCVFLCVGLGMTGVAWSKMWMSKASFNPACSMASIIIFIVIVKEGDAHVLLQVMFIVLFGALVSNTVCFFLWRQSATTNLQNNIIKVLGSFATLLEMTSQTFLLQENYHPRHSRLLRAVEEHQASFTSLKTSLTEAKSEWFDLRIRAACVNGEDAYDAACDSLTRLAQHLNGLRDGTRLQFEVLAEPGPGEGPHQSAAAMSFRHIVEDVDAPMNALSRACVLALKRMRDVFIRKGEDITQFESVAEDFFRLSEDIGRALYTFESTSNQALLRFFRKTDELNRLEPQDRPGQPRSDTSSDQSPTEATEPVFLVYFFIFTLQELARELLALTEIMSDVYSAERQVIALRQSGRFWGRAKSILLLLRRPRSVSTDIAESYEDYSKKKRRRLSGKLAKILPKASHKSSPFPKIRPHAPNTIQTPSRNTLTFVGKLKQSFWSLGARLREPDLKYAIKAGMATAILAAPAFFEATRPLFMEYRGEWALISFFVVLSPTIGATNFLSLHRIVGTLLGAFTAAAVYSAFPDNPYVLSIFGMMFSIPCFYYIVGQPKYATSGRFVLLTYNLTALYCYNLRDRPYVNPVTVAIRRSASVIIGVLWALVVSRWWWPMEARRELSKGLSDFCLNLGWLYTRLVEAYSSPEQSQLSPRVDDRTPLLETTPDRLNSSVKKFMSMELHLQIKLIELQQLLAQTQHEPRLKGPFPVHLYRTVLTSLQVMLDKLHAMRCVTTKEEWFMAVRRDFIIPVNKERREMVGNVILYFSTLSSSFVLKRALPPYLPPAEQSRERLVEAIRNLDVMRRREVKQSHHLLYFAYALMMKGVIRELDFLGHTLQDAFGVIGQSVENFEDLFRPHPVRHM